MQTLTNTNGPQNIPVSTELGLIRISSCKREWTSLKRFELINITAAINDIVRQSGVESGFVHLQSLHTTTGLLVGEWQNALLEDMDTFFHSVVNRESPWRHNDPSVSDCDRRNADSHLRALTTGPTLSLQVVGGRILLGTWQSIIFAEFDGPRTRSCSIQVFGL
jgi:secondary thiamine-phosphate synthase enzyme